MKLLLITQSQKQKTNRQKDVESIDAMYICLSVICTSWVKNRAPYWTF